MTADILTTTAELSVIIAARYVLVAALAHWLLWRRAPAGRRILRLNPAQPKLAQIRHELIASMASSPIYALPAAIVYVLWQRGGTVLYADPGLYGWVWLPVSFVLYAALHDTFYYWLHRAMHLPRVYRWTHAGHHLSRHPTPFASFSFDIAESALTAWFLPALCLIIPIDIAVMLILLTLMTASAVLNHSGWEVVPERWREGRVGRHFITAAHHALHHTRFRCNYGLYFRVWDRLMGTDRPPQREDFPVLDTASISPGRAAADLLRSAG